MVETNAEALFMLAPMPCLPCPPPSTMSESPGTQGAHDRHPRSLGENRLSSLSGLTGGWRDLNLVPTSQWEV